MCIHCIGCCIGKVPVWMRACVCASVLCTVLTCAPGTHCVSRNQRAVCILIWGSNPMNFVLVNANCYIFLFLVCL